MKDKRVALSAGFYACEQGQPSITLPVLPNQTPLTDDDNDSIYPEEDEEDVDDVDNDEGDVEADV